MDRYNIVGAAVMGTLAVGVYILLHLIAKSLDEKARKEAQQRNNRNLFDIDP